MDGARLMNAAVAMGVSCEVICSHVDSVWLDFSKGLGAPIGSVLAGSADFIAKSWRLKQQMGGAMRQSGMMAAACLYALDHNVERMADDHALAGSLAIELQRVAGIESIERPDTNLLFFSLSPSSRLGVAELVQALRSKHGIAIGGPFGGARRIRVVTHLDVGQAEGGALIAALITELGLRQEGRKEEDAASGFDWTGVESTVAAAGGGLQKPLLLLRAQGGYLGCGLVDMRTSDKLGEVAGVVRGGTMRVELIGHSKPCITEIYLYIDARMADYIRTHP